MMSHQLRAALIFASAIVFSAGFVDLPAARLALIHSADLHWIMRQLTTLGDSGWSIPAALVSVAAAMTVMAIQPRRAVLMWRNASLFVLFSLCASGLACLLLKGVIGRLRPGVMGIDDNLVFSPFTHSAQWASFPSGHTTTAMTLAFSLGLLFPRLRDGLLVLGALVGVSRVMLGVHWVSDVIAGTWLAYVTVTLIAARFPRLLSSAPVGAATA